MPCPPATIAGRSKPYLETYFVVDRLEKVKIKILLDSQQSYILTMLATLQRGFGSKLPEVICEHHVDLCRIAITDFMIDALFHVSTYKFKGKVR